MRSNRSHFPTSQNRTIEAQIEIGRSQLESDVLDDTNIILTHRKQE
jgi:hypothetical protein